ISSILPYSPKKNKAKPIAEYSTLYPETSSASASGKSKGKRFVSAKAEIKNNKKLGNKGITYHIFFCAKIISFKLYEPAHKTTVTTINPIETSYDTICAVDRSPPKKAYLELLDQPDNIIPYTPRAEIANKYNKPIFISDKSAVSLKGITAQPIKLKTNVMIGAKTNTTLSELLGNIV